VWTWYSGQWISPSLSTATSNATTTSGNVTATERPNAIGNPNSGPQTINAWFNVKAYAIPAQYTFGNAGLSTILGPAFFGTDLGIHRDFRIRERFRVTYRWEMFNAFNHTHFSNPGATIGTSTAGVISSTLPARVMQMALKLTF
jgi:hypothetical protein